MAGLIPYLRSIDPWFLSQFTEDARNRHKHNHWNSNTQEVASTEELEMVNNVYGDDELNCSDEPTAIRESKVTIEIVMPDVELTDTTPHVLQDDDSISTFRSKRSKSPSILKSASHGTSVPSNSTAPTHVTSFDDGSVSKLSDNTSRILAFEDKFNKVTEDLHQRSVQQEQNQLETKSMLAAIMQALQLQPTNPGLSSQATVGGQPSAPSIQVNSLSQSKDSGGVNHGVAGSGS